VRLGGSSSDFKNALAASRFIRSAATMRATFHSPSAGALYTRSCSTRAGLFWRRVICAMRICRSLDSGRTAITSAWMPSLILRHDTQWSQLSFPSRGGSWQFNVLARLSAKFSSAPRSTPVIRYACPSRSRSMLRRRMSAASFIVWKSAHAMRKFYQPIPTRRASYLFTNCAQLWITRKKSGFTVQ